MALLEITNLHASIAEKPILNGVSLTVKAGEVHAIMGPNGSGKSTLAQVIAGHPAYEVTSGSVMFDGQDLLDMEAEERAWAGVFLAFQYPVEIPGSPTPTSCARPITRAGRRAVSTSSIRWISSTCSRKSSRWSSGARGDGASGQFRLFGGEKKRNEILQMPCWTRLAVLDETDSGLDIDALRIVADGVNTLKRTTAQPPGDPLSTPARLHVPTSCTSWRPAGSQVGRPLPRARTREEGVRVAHGNAG